MAENDPLDVVDTCTTSILGETRSNGTSIGYSRSISTTETNSDSDNVEYQTLTSLNSKISNLEFTIESLQSKYNVIDSKCNLYKMENEILRDTVAKFDNKCIECDKLREQYDEVKMNLMSAMTTTKMHLEQYRELQLQSDALKTKYQQLEQQNIEYQQEVAELRNIRQQLNTNLISLNDAMNDSQRELYALKHVKSEENMQLISSFKEEITKLHQQIDDLNKANHALNQDEDDGDRDSLDGNEQHEPNGNEPSANETDKPYRKLIKSRSTSKSSLAGESLFTQFVSRDMEDIQASDACKCNEADYTERIVGEVTDSLWHDIDMQVIKIESLLISNKSQSHILDVNRTDSIGSDDEKSLEYNYLDDDIIELPRRLECIYNELDSKPHKECIPTADDANEVKDAYEARIDMKDIEIEKLVKELHEIKTELDEMERKAQKQYKCTKDHENETKDKYEAVITLKDKEIQKLLHEIGETKTELDTVKNDLNDMHSKLQTEDKYETIISQKSMEIEKLLNEIKEISAELVEYKKKNELQQDEIETLKTMKKDHENETKEEYEAIIALKDEEIQKLLNQISAIKTELDAVKNNLDELESESQKQYKSTKDHANEMKHKYEGIINLKDMEIEKLLNELSEIKAELDRLKNALHELQSNAKQYGYKYEAVINLKDKEIKTLLNELRETKTELDVVKNDLDECESEALKQYKYSNDRVKEMKDEYEVIVNVKDVEIEKLLNEISEIKMELDAAKNDLNELDFSAQKQYKYSRDQADEMKNEYEGIINLKDKALKKLMNELCETKTELDTVKKYFNDENEMKEKYETIINLKNIELEKLFNEIKETNTELFEYKKGNKLQKGEIERLKIMKWRYGTALLIVLLFLYLLQRYKGKNNDRVRDALRLIFGRFVITE